MSQYFPAPAATTRLVGPDGVPLSGDVSLLAGNAQLILRQGNGFLLSATSQQRARGVELFIPGVVAARTALVVPVVDAVLTSVDAYFKTAPAATDGSNFAQLRVKGLNNGSASVALPFQSNAVNEYHLGMADLSPVIGTLGAYTNAGPQGFKAYAQPFTTTTALTVGGLAFIGSDLATAGQPPGPMRIGLCTSALTSGSGHTPNTVPWVKDANGNNAYVDITTGDILPSSGAGGTHPWTSVTFPTSVALANGTVYRAVMIGQPTQNLNNQGIPVSSADTSAGGNVTNGGASIRTSAGAYDPATAVFNSGAGASLPVKLLGAVLGTALSGLVSIGIEITGAPGTPGTDLAVSIQL